MEMTKEIREGKEIYAQRKNYENAELAVLNGATEEQAQAIVRLCGDRHYIHRNRSSVFHAESGDAETIGELLSNCSTGESINDYLSKAGLPRIEYTYSFDDDTSNDYLYELEEMTYEEAEEKTEEVMSQFDEDIIKYIQDFDKKYNTHFTPSLAGRMKGYEF